jgi:hypothetical protein
LCVVASSSWYTRVMSETKGATSSTPAVPVGGDALHPQLKHFRGCDNWVREVLIKLFVDKGTIVAEGFLVLTCLGVWGNRFIDM